MVGFLRLISDLSKEVITLTVNQFNIGMLP